MIQKKLSMKNRRGVSNIIGSLIVLAIVASVGSVILFQGLNQISAFNQELTLHDKERNLALREDVLFEHVRFDPDTNELVLFLANIGTTETTIATVTVVNIDSQELILRNTTVNRTIQIEDHIEINLFPDLMPAPNDKWNSTEYNSTDYRIVVATSKGNFFDAIRTPFNS
jgi:flagellin-like protein